MIRLLAFIALLGGALVFVPFVIFLWGETTDNLQRTAIVGAVLLIASMATAMINEAWR